MIPAIHSTTSSRFSASEGLRLAPGTWWRLTDPEHEIAGKEWEPGVTPPEHGIVLLLAETHMVDGEIHAVTLHGHPLLRMGRAKLLLEAFTTAFAPCPDGEALRASELDALMGRIQAIGASMSDVPDEQVLLELHPPKPKGPPDPASGSVPNLPAALLPSGDVVAAQERIERGIALLEARSAWVKGKTDEMQHGMKIVQSYQEERVAQSLAGISEQRKMAETLLQNVHTMRLFIGEGVEVETLLKGEGAPAAEPLHLLQRMLYLDEEIFVSSVMDEGFHAENMKDLPALLSANPDLLERMLPHPRCVAIARIRRKRREFEPPDNILDALGMIEKDQQDMFVQILIRDGGNVRMVMADEETSRAERLFPSNAEIDAIFTERGGYDRERREHRTREITPFDIEYSSKRNEHDKRALFYKRFLIILWGLQERKQVFGPFIPQGANWLEETTHNRHFRFVHDEENVISDGLKPVATWISEMNEWVRPGARVLIQGTRAMSEDSAPTAYGTRGRDYDRMLEREPVNRVEELVVGRRGAELIVQLPTKERYGSRRLNTPVTLRAADGKVLRDGLLCLDRADSVTLRRYIESRHERSTYLRWLALFMEALPIVEAREAADKAVSDRLSRARPELAGAAPEAVRMVREASKAGIGPDQEERILKLADRLTRAAMLELSGEALQLRMRANGDLIRVTEALDPRAGQARMPLLEATVLKYWTGGRPQEGASRMIPFSHLPELGEAVIHSVIGPDATNSARAAATPGLRDPASFDLVRTLSGEGWTDEVSWLLDQAEGAEEHELSAWLSEARDLNYEHAVRQVQIPVMTTPVGVGIMTDPDRGRTAWALRLSVDPVRLAFHKGRDDLVRRMCARLYKRPEAGFSNLHAARERSPDPIRLERFRLTDKSPLTHPSLTDRGWSFEDWSRVISDPVCIEAGGGHFGRQPQGPAQQIAIPDGVLPALARSALLRRERTADDVKAALDVAGSGALIVAPGVEELLERVLSRTALKGPDRDAELPAPEM